MAADVEGRPKVPFLTSKRWILAYMACLGSFCVYSLRVNMSVAIVCMVKDTDSNVSNIISSNSNNNNYSYSVTSNLSSDHEASCVLETHDGESDKGEFEWDKSVQSTMMSAFFYGYLVLQIPGGWMAGRFGGKLVLGIGVLTTALATLLMPMAVRWDYRSVYALRVVMGLAQSVSFPTVHTMLGRWSPSMERTRLAAFVYSGVNLGNVVTYIVSGYLCEYGFDGGWPSIFYITGGASIIWVLLWFAIVSDSPENHPSISPAEREYILANRGDRGAQKFSVPWKSVLRSPALLVCITAQVCNNWMHYTMLTELPTFMKEVLKYDVKQNGVLSSVPYMVQFVVQMFVGHLADFLRSRYLSTAATRRLLQSVSFLASGACIVAVGFIDCSSRTSAVVLLCAALGFEAFCYAGYMVNMIDFAPRYAGVLYGISNFISTVPGIVAPEVTGALTPNKTQEEWRNVFYVCGGFTVFGTLIFGTMASGELQPWAMEDDDKTTSHKTDTDATKKREDEVGDKTKYGSTLGCGG